LKDGADASYDTVTSLDPIRRRVRIFGYLQSCCKSLALPRLTAPSASTQLADAQSFIDTLHFTLQEIETYRSRLTGSTYSTRRALRRSRLAAEPLTLVDEEHLASLTTQARKGILLTYHTIQALKAEYPLFTKSFSSSPQLLPSSAEYKKLIKRLNKLYGAFADTLNFVEDRKEEEQKDGENGSADQRLMSYMREVEPGLQEEEVLSELKAAKREATKRGDEELKVCFQFLLPASAWS
jgi:hypothetical protein